MDTFNELVKTDKRIEQKADDALGASVRTQGAFRNRAFSSGNVTVPFFGAAGSTTIYLAALLNANATGIFNASVSMGWLQAATGTYRVQVSTQTAVAKTLALTVANRTQIGPGFIPATVGSALPATQTNGAFVSATGVGAIAVTGASSNTLIQYDTGVQTIGTAATGATFGWSSDIHNSISSFVEVPFGLPTATANGSQVLLLVTIITTTAAITAMTGYEITLEERP